MHSERTNEIRKLLEQADTPHQRMELTVLLEISILIGEDGKLIAEIVVAQTRLREAFEAYVIRNDRASNRNEGAWRIVLVLLPVIAMALGWFVVRYVINQNDVQDMAIHDINDKLLTMQVQQRYNDTRIGEMAGKLLMIEQRK